MTTTFELAGDSAKQHATLICGEDGFCIGLQIATEGGSVVIEASEEGIRKLLADLLRAVKPMEDAPANALEVARAAFCHSWQ